MSDETHNAAPTVSFGMSLRRHAEAEPSRAAIILVADDGTERRVCWRELDAEVNRTARLMAAGGVHQRSIVIVALPACLEHYLATLAAWRLGACVLPLNPELPAPERDGLLDIAAAWRPAVVVGNWDLPAVGVIPAQALDDRGRFDAAPLDDIVPHPGKAVGSGGSTGRSKIILDPSPWARVPGRTGWPGMCGLRADGVQLVTGKLHHNLGFTLGHAGLFEGQTLVVMERFEAALAVELVERHRVTFAGLAPIVMQRIARLPDVKRRDFSSIVGFYHSGAPCPDWVKRVWLELVAPERQWNAFGAAENVGGVFCRGDEWLARPGVLGRPLDCDLKILDDEQRELPPGEVGEIFTRLKPSDSGEPPPPAYMYLGAPPARTTADGFVSVGDMGYVDAEGWVWLADRRTDLILSGAANVYPAEVEGALTEHPEVADAVVVGVPDEEWGQRVHALIQPRDAAAPPGVEELDVFCRQRLVGYKAPKSYEFVAALPRESSGKLRRSTLAQARSAGWTSAMVAVARSRASA